MYDNLRETLSQQKIALTNLENEIRTITDSDIASENTKLRQDLEQLTAAHKQSLAQLKEADAINTGLKSRLYEQIYNEKISTVVNISDRANIYFKSTNEAELNRLSRLFENFKHRTNQITNYLKQNSVDISDEIYAKINELEKLALAKVTEVRAENARQGSQLMAESGTQLQKLKNEQITDEHIKKIAKKNNIEAFIGGNLINKAGILLIIVGILLFSRLVYTNITDEVRGIIMFAAGCAMLGVGEFLNRKKAGIASLGLSAGGIAGLYIAGAVSYFNFGILSMYTAILVCVLVTAAAFFLSIRYNSQTIAAFALFGGYMPVFAMPGGGATIVYGAMVYFLTLNAFALLIAYHKKWTICYFIGFTLNTLGTIFIIDLSQAAVGASYGHAINRYMLIAYTFFAFLVYTAVPMLSTFRTKIAFKRRDIVLLGLNTFISAVTIYSLFFMLGLGDFAGAISVIFTAVYIILGQLVEKKLTGEKHASMLFYLTGLTFIVLFIPFQFDTHWISLGWLIQGTLLAGYGICKDHKAFTRVGFIINGLCLGAFVLFDLPLNVFGASQHFSFKYFALTLASLLLLGAFIYKRRQFDTKPTVFRIATFVNLWIYVIYFVASIADPRLMNLLEGHMTSNHAGMISGYTSTSLVIVAMFLLAWLLLKNSYVADKATRVFSIILYALGVFMVLGMNARNVSLFNMHTPHMMVTVIGTVLLLITNAIALIAVNDIVKFFVAGKKLGIEFYPIIVSAFFILILTQNIMVQFQLQFSNMVISLIFAVASVLWIVYGFVRRYTYIRRFGLGLAMFSVVKLLLLDLWNQTAGHRIILFIALGAALVIISFVYQFFVKRLEREDYGE